MQSLQGKNVEVVICMGTGRRSVPALQDMSIIVFIGEENIVASSMQKFRENQLTPLTMKNACQGYRHHVHGQ
jgi:predicted Fe-Mo cluster-binding NifX family protein